MRILGLLAFSISNWLLKLGGPGLVLLALADNSLVPLPGSQDAFTILLASANKEWWPYYAFMSTVGAVIGGYLTYRLAEKGGEESLEKKIGKRSAEKAYKRFEKHGSLTIIIGAVLPPPVPIVPFLMAPGVMHYPTKKFLLALAVGRGMRYFALAYVGHIYGDSILRFFGQYKEPVMYSLIGLAVLGGIGALLYFKYYRPKRRREERERGEPVEELPIPGRGNEKLKQQEQGGQQSANEQIDERDKEKKTA